MSRKSNPTTIQTGITKKWQSKYIEKKSTESAQHVFNDLEIKKFLNRIFDKNGLKIHNCKLDHFENSLTITVTYYLGARVLLFLKESKDKQNFYFSPKVKSYKTNTVFINKHKGIKLKSQKKLEYKKLLKKHKYISHNLPLKKKVKRRLELIKEYKNIISKNNQGYYDFELKNSFLNTLKENITLFTSKNSTVILNLHQINFDTVNKISKSNLTKFKKNIGKIRRFKQNDFFKEAVHTILYFLRYYQSSKFLAEFIAKELQNQKRHNFFFKFIKKALSTLNKKEFCDTKNVKIQIKGRINRSRRTRKKIIRVGDNIPVMSIKSNIDYGEATAFSSNGTFGIKVWSHSPEIKT